MVAAGCEGIGMRLGDPFAPMCAAGYRIAPGGHDGRRTPACKAVSGSSTQRCAALALGQWNGERDAECLTDAPGDVPMAGQVFGDQHVAGEEPARAPVRGLKFRDA